MPADSVPWAVGTLGTDLTCSIQGFLILTFYLAFPFYYASLSVLANVALKNNFQEEKYAWMEIWIHVGAYLVPVIMAIYFAAKDQIQPGVTFCAVDFPSDIAYCEQNGIDPNCDSRDTTRFFAVVATIILLELMVGTITMIHLLCTFEKVQKEVEHAIGMKEILETARKRRFQAVLIQAGLYLASFWVGYLPTVIECIVRITTEKVYYELVVVAQCIFCGQGFVIMVIYIALQPRRETSASENMPHRFSMPEGCNQETVDRIRANAAMLRSTSLKSSLGNKFAFSIFDGTPAEDSPWRSYLNLDDDDLSEGLIGTVVEEEEESVSRENLALPSLDSSA